ncbi:PREDICTED: uncharacterized protein LOC105961508 [Erythranthe guttata]|uniref:uncharacterized protein LOC105961508 n=1 Tax=Erythranthe guttata TaxID=4155 RepID=UPI00064DE1BA|nr:PREDICTED: uncharacterized protein LOC105961508 [Erythranthe guttata]|eukprot:XP_012841191.1 PREDICTED: uncharacterized protein LOC105961508 [Erythranthe guttata]
MELLIAALSKNPYSIFFKRLQTWNDLRDAHIVIRSNSKLDQRTYNLPTADEVAAVWNDSDGASIERERDIRVYTDGGHNHKVKYHYVLQINKNSRRNISCREFPCYRAQMREHVPSYLLHSGRLGHQYAIDSYVKLETSRLDYYRCDQLQQEFWIESFQEITDSLCIDGENDPANVGKKVLLPSSFIGGPRDMKKRYVNAMALVQRYGKPDIFSTMTCNPAWKEIKDKLLPNEKPHDRPDLIARVFKAKLEELKDEIVRKNFLVKLQRMYMQSSLKNGVCLTPIGSYPCYKRRDDGKTVVVRKVRLDNRHIVPYCPYLLAKFDCHINVEICSDIKLVKYLYKYNYKGHDKMAYHVVGNKSHGSYDEIQAFQDGRYICAPEAYWRIYAFSMSEIHPAVIILPVHLPNHQPLRFGLHQPLEKLLQNPISSKTMLTEFFWMNSNDLNAKHLKLLYKEFPEYFVWDSKSRKWKLRQKQVVVGRLSTVSPFEGERYYERLLLMHVRCTQSFKDLKPIGNDLVGSFREAAVFRGLLESDDYIDNCLAEAIHYQMPCSLRRLFAMLLVYGVVPNPQVLWDKYYSAFCEDFSRFDGMPEAEIMRKTIRAIDNFLLFMDKSISDFSLRFPISYSSVRDKMSREYEHEQNMEISKEDLLSSHTLNDDQRIAFDMIVSKINSNEGGVFFVDGPGGTGKTFLYRALLAYVRSKGNIALAVATSGVAASLLPGGRIAHSRFKLPFDLQDKSIGNISKQCNLAKMIINAKLVVWDEASMANHHSTEALDELLRNLMSDDSPFGGKVILFGRDFRQTLSIVPGGSRESMIAASIVSSVIWPNVTKIGLQKNMRAKEDPCFGSFLMRIGDGDEPFVFENNIIIPQNMLIPFVDTKTSLNMLIRSVFPCFNLFHTDPYKLINRAILTSKNECVEEINDLLIDSFPGTLRKYVSYNKTIDSNQQGEYEDYLNSISVSGLPPHILRLKKNCPIMLLRNLDPIEGLCNETRLICRELGQNFIGAEIAVGDFKGNHVFVPRIPLESSDKQKCPIPFKRMQFPVRPYFVMTINKAQGQTLEFVGVYLREPVFSHGQLYVALSRARSADAVKILIQPSCEKALVPVQYTKWKFKTLFM